MPFDEHLAGRIRELLEDEEGFVEKKMFGGVAFLLKGNMCCGVVRNDLMLRVGPDAYEEALAKPHARPMDFTGRPLKGMVYVSPEGIRTKRSLRSWLDGAKRFVDSLPPK